jgi:mannose-6-phosphate isomerase-like protein (cupin superfamily)
MYVKKPWGHELRWAITEKYLGKILHIKPKQRLSRQYHEQKDETIYVLEGVLLLEIGKGNDIEVLHMGMGEAYRVKPGTVHRFCAGEKSCTLIEVSTPEINDVVRLEDDYDRTGE